MPEVKDRILAQYDSLSRAQKKGADFIISNPDAAAMLSSIELGKRAGISEPTVVRLAYALGYGGFTAMQKQIQQDYLTSFYDEPQTSEQINEYEMMVENEIRMFRELQSYVSDPTKLERIAKTIVDADMVEIFGYYGEHTVAFELYLVLDAIRPNVHYYRENNIGFREIAALNRNSVVLSFLFDPYCPGTVELMKETKQKGATLITVTDSLISPGARLSDEVVCFSLRQDSETGINSMAPAMLFIQLLLRAIKKIDHENVMERTRKVQSQLLQPGTPHPRLGTDWF